MLVFFQDDFDVDGLGIVVQIVDFFDLFLYFIIVEVCYNIGGIFVVKKMIIDGYFDDCIGEDFVWFYVELIVFVFGIISVKIVDGVYLLFDNMLVLILLMVSDMCVCLQIQFEFLIWEVEVLFG